MDRKVHVKIDRMGNATVEAEGFMGQGCEAATAHIERALAGGDGVERTYKAEWAQTPVETDNANHMTL